MKGNPLPSRAEKNASKAQNLDLFSRFNLVGARSSLEELLAQIGRNDIFKQYTKHDISHIDVLLEMLDWIIPRETTELMTPTDWMLIVLAIYFHDAGLIVTEQEFERRESTDFPAFRDEVLKNPTPSSYQERARGLNREEQEVFLYQEFVRVHHAERIKRWIAGEESTRLGAANEAAEIVAELIREIDDDFKRDLALVCESHHSDDLDNLSKYNPRRAYGSARLETANLQYAAILLRTVDLLHVTKDRTPSVAFRLATPTDPKSIEEWSKQMSTVAVRHVLPRDESGNVVPNAIPDTIQVTATFKDAPGYFSLTEYLDYAEKQLKQSQQWVEQTKVKELLNFSFPWKKIDTTQIKALNFVSKQFVFELDKPKILNLLTGHTLYSNSEVVVRELIQNSLDAIRLQKRISEDSGEIIVHLDTTKRTLTIDDNGTGMTQQIIEDHFFNVGSSRYRDPRFYKEYPEFSAISRFGIGILTIFMISDEIEVLTKPSSENEIRNISIRSLTGKYLIRMLKPNDKSVPEQLRRRGTRVQLKMRAGVPLPDVRAIAEHWILFPECRVTVQIDGQSPIEVGYPSPKAALEGALLKAGCQLFEGESGQGSSVFKVIEEQKAGLTMAIALRWQPYYKNWAFATVESLAPTIPGNVSAAPSALCIQGIRVESTSPGFAGQTIVSVSNITGSRSPATNVARSSLESGQSTDEMFARIFEMYARHVSREIECMASQKKRSLSEAASEGRYLTFPFQNALATTQCANAYQFFNKEMKTIPWLTIDSGGARGLVTIDQLVERAEFWTIESIAYRSAEEFLLRVPNKASLTQLASLVGSTVMIPDGDILGGFSDNRLVRNLIFETFEVDQILLQETERQASLHWRPVSSSPLWKSIIPTQTERRQKVEQFIQTVGRINTQRGVRYRALTIQNSDKVTIVGAHGECGLAGSAQTYIFKDNDVYSVLQNQFDALETGKATEAEFAFVVVIVNLILAEAWMEAPAHRSRIFNQLQQQFGQHSSSDIRVPDGLKLLMEGEKPNLFDPMRGDRMSPWYTMHTNNFMD